ncbi:MAG: hypothetical protein GW886_11830 [Rhodobacterales bacterium]|nr:hypothetical protein [Rhodobacterales bacterium]
MTALKEYQRLESPGIWRPEAEGQRRDVAVSFGNATLVLMDGAGRPVAHWSLPAIVRLNPGTRPALYAPDEDATETLEIEDDLMIGAIERVRRSLLRRQPRPGRLRNTGVALVSAALLGLAVFWLPGALTRQTLMVVPPGKRSEIGATLLGHVQRVTGPTCRQAAGTAALGRLRDRLMPAGSGGQIVVVPGPLPHVLALPGRIVVLSGDLIAENDDPEVIAGHVIAALVQQSTTDPLGPLLDTAGLWTTLRLLATGDIPAEVLQAHAARLLADAPPDLPGDRLLAGFASAAVAATPYAYSVDITGETVLHLIEADPMAGQQHSPVMTDQDWISLQGICG